LNKLFKEHEINHFSTKSKLKAIMVERFNRTLKERMWKIFSENDNHRWIDILDDLVENYNNTYHTSIKMRPIEARKAENRQIVFANLYEEELKNNTRLKEGVKNSKFKVGDKVRIVKHKAIFDKGYLPNWWTEIFIINKVFDTVPVTYEIKDLADDIKKGKFYNEELTIYNKITDVYKVEKILRRRTRNGIREVLIKWFEYPDKFNSWELESDLNLSINE